MTFLTILTVCVEYGPLVKTHIENSQFCIQVEIKFQLRFVLRCVLLFWIALSSKPHHIMQTPPGY